VIHLATLTTGSLESAVAYRNVLADGTLAWSSETADGFAANALGPQTYDFWAPAAMPATLSVTLADAIRCDCAAIVAHTLGSSGATAYVEARNGSGSWVTLASITPTDNSDVILLFYAAIEYDQWRIRLTGSTAPAVGIAWIGPRLIVPGGTKAGYVPLHQALDIDLMPNISRGGQFIGSRIQKVGASTSAGLAPQERWWVEGDGADFIAHYNEGKPFLWMSCPELFPKDGHYCWRSGNTLRPSFGQGALFADMTLEVQAYVGS
jgi:hypothetical protein